MKITPQLFEAYLKCPMKCYIRSTGQTGTANAYAEWVQSQHSAYKAEVTKRLTEAVPEHERVVNPPPGEDPKAATWRLAVGLPVESGNMEARLHAVERLPSQGRGEPARFVPVRFSPFTKLTKDDKLLLAFDALLLNTVRGEADVGKIIHGEDQTTRRIRVASLLGVARKLALKAEALLAGGSPPDLILNRHCGECEFRDSCRQKALEKDDLSLLPNLAEKERGKLNNEGIFTLTQLSYKFRPRRRPKRLRNRREKFHHALKALAIRTKKIHILGAPELKIDGTPVYLDVEGLPDKEFYYLIGVRFKSSGTVVQRSFWADKAEDEKGIWGGFIGTLAEIENPVLVHYGSFETAFLKTMSRRHGGPPEGSPAAKAMESAVNILSVIYAQIYFPTYSNGLKEVGAWVGCEWSGAGSSGAQSVVWRMNWQRSGDPSIQRDLMVYNSDDCHALQTVTESVARLCSPDHRPDLENGADPAAVLADNAGSRDTLWRAFASSNESFGVINKAARWDSQREKVYIRTDNLSKRSSKSKPLANNRPTRVNEEKDHDGPIVCPGCGKKPEFKAFRRKKTYDLRFSRYGIRRWVVGHRYEAYWCRRCHKTVGAPEEIKTWGVNGRNLVMFIAFQTVELCIPQRTVAHGLNRLFGLGLHESGVCRLKGMAANFYTDTRDRILAKLVKGNLIQS